MQNRRELIGRSLAGAAVVPLAGCSAPDIGGYDAAVGCLRAPLAATPAFAELVRFAALAPNGHNTQPWLFAPRGRGATIVPNLSRRAPAVDPDDRRDARGPSRPALTFSMAEPYKTLGVVKTADADDIRRAYRNLAKKPIPI